MQIGVRGADVVGSMFRGLIAQARHEVESLEITEIHIAIIRHPTDTQHHVSLFGGRGEERWVAQSQPHSPITRFCGLHTSGKAAVAAVAWLRQFASGHIRYRWPITFCSECTTLNASFSWLRSKLEMSPSGR